MKAFEPKKLLVTGGAGFIGANFIHYYLQHRDVQIINLDKLTYAGSLDYLQNIPRPHQHVFIQGDICDAALIMQLLQEYKIDTIIHFAAESHVDRSIATPRDFVQTNVVGTFTLLEAAKTFWLDNNHFDASQCRFHHVSTDEVYGSLAMEASPVTEHSPYQPNSPYAASKASADHLVRAYFQTYGLPTTQSNCSNNYGRFQHPEKFIPKMIRHILNGEHIPIYGDGKQRRDWLYVEDHCHAIELILKSGKPGEHYNVGAENEWSNLELAGLVCQLLDVHHPRSAPHAQFIEHAPDRKGHDRRYGLNPEKIRQELNWFPRWNFRHGLEQTVKHFLEVL